MTGEPIVPWIGGKRRLAERLIRLFPQHSCYVEPFAGAAAVLFAKQPSDVEVLNDVNGELVNLYRVVQHHLEEFVRQFKWALSSRAMFKWMQLQPSAPLTDIQRAARFYYLQVNAYGAKLEHQTWGTATTTPPGLNLLRLEEQLSAAHLRLASVYVENLDWRECVTRYDRPHSLFYMDPPYWDTEGYGVPFTIEQYALMAQAMREIRGRAVLSVNDHPAMREAFAGFPIETIDITYQVGGTSRGQNHNADRRELVIFSWDRKPEEGGLF